MKGIVFVLILVLAISISFWMGLQRYYISRDTESWLVRAQVASNPEDMKDYLMNLKKGMEKWRLTEGNACLVWKNPETEMPLIMKSIDSSIERVENVRGMSKTSVEYQSALDDLRGTLRELKIYSFARWNVDYWIFNIIITVLWIAATGSLFSLFWWLCGIY